MRGNRLATLALFVVVGAGVGLWAVRASAPAGGGAPVAARQPVVSAPAASAPLSVSDSLTGRLGDARGTLTVRTSPVGAVRTALLFRAAPPRSVVPWLRLPDLSLDAEGEATLPLAPGQYFVEVASGAGRASGAVEVSAGLQSSLGLSLRPGWGITLRVVAEKTGQPVPRARAQLRPPGLFRDGAGSALEERFDGDALGRVVLSGLPDGEVFAQVLAPGFLPRGIQLAAQAQAAQRTVELTPAVVVEGWVRDENGTPIEGATVSDALNDTSAVRTDAHGAFLLGMEPGDGQLTAFDPAGRSTTKAVKVPESGVLRGVELLLGDPLRLTGRVVDEGSRAPVAGAVVSAVATRGEALVARAVSGPDGRFELDGLPPGWVSIHAVVGRGARGRLHSVSTASKEPLELALQAASALWGTVHDEGARPIAGAQVTLRALESGEELVAQSDDSGTYRFEDVAPGNARVSASLGDEARSQPKDLTLSSGAAVRADLSLLAAATLAGQVTGKAPGPYHVTVLRSGGARGFMADRLTREDGTFEVTLPPGDYKVAASPLSGLRALRPEAVALEAGKRTWVDLALVELTDAEEAQDRGAALVEPGTIGAAFDAAGGRVLVSWASTGSPAATAGVRVGDEVVAVDGQPVATSLDAFARTRGEPGSSVQLSLRRSGAALAITVGRQRASDVFLIKH